MTIFRVEVITVFWKYTEPIVIFICIATPLRKLSRIPERGPGRGQMQERLAKQQMNDPN